MTAHRVFAFRDGRIAFVNKFPDAAQADLLAQKIRRRYAGLIEAWATTADHRADVTWSDMKAGKAQRARQGRGAHARHRNKAPPRPERNLRRALDCEAALGFAPSAGMRLVKARQTPDPQG
jgi:hypothetical protein